MVDWRYLFIDELDLVEDEDERYPRGLGLDEEPGERCGLGPGLVEREEDDEAVDIGDGRVGDLGPPLEDVLDHPAAVGPVDGSHEDPVPDEHAAADLLEQRPHDAEQVRPAVLLEVVARGHGVHDDAHEVGLRGGDQAGSLGREERIRGRRREGGGQREEARVVVGGGGAAEEGEGEGEGVVAEREGEWKRERGEAEAGQRRRSGEGERRHFGEEGRSEVDRLVPGEGRRNDRI